MIDEDKEVSTVVSPRYWKMRVPPEPVKFPTTLRGDRCMMT
jgi:hypothetical protein